MITDPAVTPGNVTPVVINCEREDCPPPIRVDIYIPDGHGDLGRKVVDHLLGGKGVDVYLYFPTTRYSLARTARSKTEAPAVRKFPATFPTWKRGYTRLEWSDLDLSKRGIRLQLDLEPIGAKKESTIHVEVFTHGQDPERAWPLGRSFSLMTSKLSSFRHRTARSRAT